MKQFLKSAEVVLINGGYLSNKEGKPVFNEKFVDAQKHAEYIVTFATMAKEKDFVGKKADNLEDLKEAVKKALAAKETKFVALPESPVKKLTEDLAKEALEFLSFKKDTTKVEKMNTFLQQFNVLKEFEEFGLFFDEDIVKLNRIYTLEEVVNSVKSAIELLN